MPDPYMDVAVANRFISSLSKSLQALCHGCMDFDSGIEIVGYINVNIDCGSKVDYVLNEKVLKSTTNSMTFVSNSFLAKKDSPKQTRDGACSPIPELRPLHNTSFRGAYQSPRSSMQYSHSFGHRGLQKRPWPNVERDWRISHKRHRGRGASHPYPSTHVQSHTSSAPLSDTSDFKVPASTDEPPQSDMAHSLVNIKKEIAEGDNSAQPSQADSEHPSADNSNEESTQPPELNIKKDPDNETDTPDLQKTNDSGTEDHGADFKGTFLHPENASNNANEASNTGVGDETAGQIESEASETLNLPGGESGQSDNYSENYPSGSGEYEEGGGEESYSQSAFSDAGEGSSDAGQFEVIEIEDEDEDMQGLFADSRENRLRRKRLRQALKATKMMHRNRSLSENSNEEGNTLCEDISSDTYTPRGSVEICSFCRIALPIGTSYQQHFSEVHSLEKVDPSHDFTETFTCEICLKTFITRERLRQHSTVHDSAIYSCFVCDVKIKHKKNIKRHLESTHGLKKCNFCMALFSKGEPFDRHIISCINSVKGEIGQDMESLMDDF